MPVVRIYLLETYNGALITSHNSFNLEKKLTLKPSGIVFVPNNT